MNKLDHAVTNNINNKYKCNDAIEYDSKYDNIFSLSSGTNDPLSVVTVRLRGGKKHRENKSYCLTCLWDSGATNRMIKCDTITLNSARCVPIKVEYSTAAGPYCTTHDGKVPFFMLEFSSSKIKFHCFHVDNNEGE